MNATIDKFEKMGARCKVRELVPPDRPRPSFLPAPRPRAPLTIDILNDRKGQYFDLAVTDGVQVEVLQVDPKDRHLVLMARDGSDKPRFLCGHDEREWFVAAIPEATPVTTVVAAKEALKPTGVVSATSLKRRERGKRRTSAYRRQGEWFFVPRQNFDSEGLPILRDEIITRSGRGGKPHVCSELIRIGGRTVMRIGNRILRMDQWNALTEKERKGPWTQQMSEARVFVRGTIRHPDHKTLTLSGWHEVLLNTEQKARAMSHVAFID